MAVGYTPGVSLSFNTSREKATVIDEFELEMRQSLLDKPPFKLLRAC